MAFWFLCSPDHINEDEARAALRTFVSENCCYGKAAVNTMKLDKIVASNAYHVRTSTVSSSHLDSAAPTVVKQKNVFAQC